MALEVNIYFRKNGAYINTVNLTHLGEVVSTILGRKATLKEVIDFYFSQDDNYVDLGYTSEDYILRCVPIKGGAA
jgi:hypothetical protein